MGGVDVESPRSPVSHYQAVPHHHCRHISVEFGLSRALEEGRGGLSGKLARSRCLYFPPSTTSSERLQQRGSGTMWRKRSA